MASSSPLFAGEVQFGYLVADLDGAAHFAFLADYEVAFPLVFIVADAARLPAQMQEDKVLQLIPGSVREVGRSSFANPKSMAYTFFGFRACTFSE